MSYGWIYVDTGIVIAQTVQHWLVYVHWSIWHFRFEKLLNANTARLYMQEFSKNWVGIRLGLAHALVHSFTALMIFLLRDVVPPSFAGAVLVYVFQVTKVQ